VSTEIPSRMPGDYGFRGFFELSTPQHLFTKLRHDYERLERNPLDSYAAFDFFVTANCLVDWCWPSATASQLRANRRADTILRICEHLADGAKHFLLCRPHQGVEGTRRVLGGGLATMRLGGTRLGERGRLVVVLESTEAAELMKSEIPVLELASLVLQYWNRRGVASI
jgi:hypothetical protein